ncbi:diaminobutyrate acetyltransferase [Glycomyces sambucus]|nr:diaminobutyrate acetyltransferase [Glycomyces sambucus]
MPTGDTGAHGPAGAGTQVRGSSGSAQEPLDPGMPPLELGPPGPGDGAPMERLARESGGLDVNSGYAYLLWCRDFADTSVVARAGGRLAGFITGYRRPAAPDTLFVWQVAVGPDHRRRGLASRMLGHLAETVRAEGVRFVEATVTPGNKASMHLFESFAKRSGSDLTRDVLFSEHELGSGHEPEVLQRIGPLTRPVGEAGGPLARPSDPRGAEGRVRS